MNCFNPGLRIAGAFKAVKKAVLKRTRSSSRVFDFKEFVSAVEGDEEIAKKPCYPKIPVVPIVEVEKPTPC